MILVMASIGVERIAPGTPHIQYQKISTVPLVRVILNDQIERAYALVYFYEIGE